MFNCRTRRDSTVKGRRTWISSNPGYRIQGVYVNCAVKDHFFMHKGRQNINTTNRTSFLLPITRANGMGSRHQLGQLIKLQFTDQVNVSVISGRWTEEEVEEGFPGRSHNCDAQKGGPTWLTLIPKWNGILLPLGSDYVPEKSNRDCCNFSQNHWANYCNAEASEVSHWAHNGSGIGFVVPTVYILFVG